VIFDRAAGTTSLASPNVLPGHDVRSSPSVLLGHPPGFLRVSVVPVHNFLSSSNRLLAPHSVLREFLSWVAHQGCFCVRAVAVFSNSAKPSQENGTDGVLRHSIRA
jgi:hypothetical protein